MRCEDNRGPRNLAKAAAGRRYILGPHQFVRLRPRHGLKWRVNNVSSVSSSYITFSRKICALTFRIFTQSSCSSIALLPCSRAFDLEKWNEEWADKTHRWIHMAPASRTFTLTLRPSNYIVRIYFFLPPFSLHLDIVSKTFFLFSFFFAHEPKGLANSKLLIRFREIQQTRDSARIHYGVRSWPRERELISSRAQLDSEKFQCATLVQMKLHAHPEIKIWFLKFYKG